MDHGHAAAEPLQIPGTVDIGDLLQDTDGQGHKHHTRSKVTEIRPMSCQARQAITARPSEQRENANETHQITPACMEQLVRPPVVPRNPFVRRGIEEESSSNQQIAFEQYEH